MKMIYGGVPVNSLKVKHYEVSTNDCDMIASDLQAGKTAVARGQKITGTGKSFEFALYGDTTSNAILPLPTLLNVLSITSHTHPVQMNDRLFDLLEKDFTVEQEIGTAVVEGVSYPIKAIVSSNILQFICDKTINLQFFCGKDNYI